MDLLLSWIVFPAAALALCGGIGLLVERAAGTRIFGPLLPGVGLCGLVVVTQVTTTWAWSAPATVWVALALALAGAVLGRARLRRLRPDGWAVAAALVTFAIAAAPVVLSGSATFAGYTVLADTSIHVMGAEALLDHGRDFASLPDSTYRGALVSYYNGSAYPAGAPTALGTISRVVGADPLWTFAPFMVLLLAQLALALYALAGTALPRGALRAGVATVAAQPAIVFTYALQGSVKEVGAASLVGLIAALVPWYVGRREEGDGPRPVVVLAVATAAAAAVVGAVALVWAGPLLAVALVLGTRRAPGHGRLDTIVSAGVLGLVVLALSVQTLNGLGTYLDVTNSGRTPEARTGNLKQPLSPAQSLGVWLRGDHRDRPDGPRKPATILLEILVAATALLGAVVLARRRIWAPPVFLAVMAGATVLLAWQGTNWSDAKAYMIASVAPVFVALLGAAYLLRDAGVPRLGRAAAAAALTAIGLGVLASNALAYREVSLAPRDRLEELASVADRFAGKGPVLTPEYEEFAKVVLRDLAPESPVEGWRSRALQLADPAHAPNLLGTSVENGQLADAYVRQFPLMVVRRGFSESRAPEGYRLAWQGRWYDVWQRDDAARKVLATLPLGRGRQAAAVPDCAAVARLADTARAAGGTLTYVAREPTPIFAPGRVKHAWNWVTESGDPDAVALFGPGRARGAITVTTPGRYVVWMETRVGRPAQVLVDRRVVGQVRDRLNPRRSAERVAVVDLPAGRHTVEVLVGGGGLRPGDAGVNRIIGAIGFTREDSARLPVRTIPVARWRELCGRSLDWIAAVGPAR